ncbi:MAG: prepilin-type N-terminal cleavage/methylation domain-containing protein, partial [Akkermansiaceae bacterium]|nr:prepilin-type N-terminal cleavage/methylation domain-containing protein [Verrucomicrobiales bacterium]
FSLVEMLVVLVIIAILAGLTLPHIRGHSESVAIDAATHQLVEDLAFARQKAISQRSTVVVVFLTDAIYDPGQVSFAIASKQEQDEIQRLRGGVFTHYAIYGLRRVGEQPGHRTAGYLTEWKSLPEKTFLPTNNNFRVSLLPMERFPFPFSTSENEPVLPYIAFDSEGRSIKLAASLSGQGTGFLDAAVSIARGAVFYARDNQGAILPGNLELQEIPPYNGTGNVVRVDLLTGRARRDQTLLR